MVVGIRSDQSRRRKWTIGSLMIAIAALCCVFTVARPLTTPPTIRAAKEVLRRYGPAGLDLDQYQAKIVRKTVSGQWQVDFVRISGSGAAKHSAFVSDDTVGKFRFNPWYALPRSSQIPKPVGPAIMAQAPRATPVSPTTTQFLPTPLHPGVRGRPSPL